MENKDCLSCSQRETLKWAFMLNPTQTQLWHSLLCLCWDGWRGRLWVCRMTAMCPWYAGHLDLSIWLLAQQAPEGKKGHMTSWAISCNNARFRFLNGCLFVMLPSVSTVVVCTELTYGPTQHFLLILPVHRWMRMEFKHTTIR